MNANRMGMTRDIGRRRGRRCIRWCALLLGAMLVSSAWAQVPSGRDIVERVESLLWGNTVQGDYEMTITTPRWQRMLTLRAWMERPRRSFIRVLAPAKEAGIGSLRIGSEMWNYLPNVERVVKIPPSMMLQPWLGSDFTNDDLVKESSAIDDYTHKIVDTAPIDGETVYRVEATPKPQAAVVWGRVLYVVRQRDLMPLQQQYFSERGELVRVMSFSEVRSLGGRTLPTRWEMRPTAKPGNMTTVRLVDVVFDRPIDDAVFTQRNLVKP